MVDLRNCGIREIITFCFVNLCRDSFSFNFNWAKDLRFSETVTISQTMSIICEVSWRWMGKICLLETNICCVFIDWHAVVGDDTSSDLSTWSTIVCVFIINGLDVAEEEEEVVVIYVIVLCIILMKKLFEKMSPNEHLMLNCKLTII